MFDSCLLSGKQVANVVDEILAEQGMFLCFLLLVVDEIFRNLWIIRNSDMMMIDQMECYAIYIYFFLHAQLLLLRLLYQLVPLIMKFPIRVAPAVLVSFSLKCIGSLVNC